MATIVVVGGGAAGLACGWRLARQGHAVRLLERGDEVGGRARTWRRSARRGVYRLDAGCPVVVPAQRRVLALAREAGVLGSLRALAFGADLHGRDGTLAAVSRRDLLDLAASPSARAIVRAALDFRRAARVFDPQASGAGAVSAECVQRAVAVDALACWPEVREPWEDAVGSTLRASLPLAAPHAFAGGMGVLADALAKPLDVVAGCEVSRLESDSEGAQVWYRLGGGERHERADAAVLAVPATRVARMCPKLTPEERGFFEGARSEPGIVVHLLFERAPDAGPRSVVFGREGGLEISSVSAEHAREGAAPHGAGVWRALLAPQAASRMFRASDASIADLVLENLAYSPVGAPRPDGFAVWRHADAWPRFDPDDCRRVARFAARLERSPRLAFAGDALAGASLDGAVASGLQAAREIAQAL